MSGLSSHLMHHFGEDIKGLTWEGGDDRGDGKGYRDKEKIVGSPVHFIHYLHLRNENRENGLERVKGAGDGKRSLIHVLFLFPLHSFLSLFIISLSSFHRNL